MGLVVTSVFSRGHGGIARGPRCMLFTQHKVQLVLRTPAWAVLLAIVFLATAGVQDDHNPYAGDAKAAKGG